MAIEQERELETIDVNVNMGPQHPSTHGVFRMVITVDGERIVDLVPHIGYLHRGAEKLSEAMDYRQGIGFHDRTEYLAQFHAELAFVEAVEKAAGIEPPERAQYIRIILCELNRLTSHYMFMGAFSADLGFFGTGFTYAFREREYIQDVFEEVTGDRLMYGYFRPGGLGWDVPENFKERVQWALEKTKIGIADLDGLISESEVTLARTRGIGAISAEQAIQLGVTGPSLRACGVPYDLRKVAPYCIYDRFDFDVPVGTNGDVYDRYMVRLEEMRQSVRIVEQALRDLPEGPIMPEKMPRKLRVPPLELYHAVEAPRGEYGVYLVSKGGDRPYRLKIRSACLGNLHALRDMAVGHYVADTVLILGSLDIVLSEVDR